MTGFKMTGFTGFLKVRHGVDDESMLKAIAAVEQLLFNVETWGEARASKMSEFLEMVGLDIPDEDVELYYRAYSIPAYVNERMGREVIPLNEWDKYYEPVTWVNDLVYDDFQEVCEFIHFVLDYYGEYEGVEEFTELVSEELAQKEIKMIIEEARKVVEFFKYHNKNLTKAQDFVLDDLEEALEKAEGEWIEGESYPYCSCCGNACFEDTEWGFQKFDYCPNCGAKMNK